MDSDAWQMLDMAKVFGCIASFTFDTEHEVFRIVDQCGKTHTMSATQAREAYADAFTAMVDSLLETDTSGPEFTTETGVRMKVDPLPYIPDWQDRRDVYPVHWRSPHEQHCSNPQSST